MSSRYISDISTWNYWFLATMSLIFVFCLIVIVIIIKKRNMQPLKKRSPLLLIASVIGHFFVMFDITMLSVWFDIIIDQ